MTGPRQLSRILILASTPYLGHQLYDQRLARAIRDSGKAVVYVEPAVPVGLKRAWHHGSSRRLSWSADGITVVTPKMTPLGRRSPLAPLTALMVFAQIIVATRSLRPGTGVIMCAAHPLLARTFSKVPRVALIKDDYVLGSSLTGQNPRPMLRRRRALLREVECIAVVSPTLSETMLREGARAHVVPPGCDPPVAGLPEPACLSPVAHPRALFVGMLSDRIDFQILESVVEAGVSLVLAGRRQFRFSEHERYERLVKTGLVSELGEMEPDLLQAVMSSCDVGLVPYSLSDFNLASFPLKTFEYLAAGLPIVASQLPSVQWLGDPNIFLTSSAEETQLALSSALQAAASPGSRDECRATAGQNTWGMRALTFIDLLEGQDQR